MALLERGTQISETLVVDRLLGEGAFAEVHRVKHEYLGWQAMKLFKRVASLGETRTMLGEARLLSTLGHPNIVRLFDANTVQTADGRRGYFTMEYIAGGSLARFLAAHRAGNLAVDVAVQIVRQIAAGLATAHDQSPPIMHRDLTLANVLVGYDGVGMRARISDFGLAKGADPVTLLASAQGTYAFMAPEVLDDNGFSCASDVFSLGTIAYLMLTNDYPYLDEQGVPSASVARFGTPPLPPSKYNDDVDAELDTIVLNTLVADPAERIGNAELLVKRLTERGEPASRKRPARRPEQPETALPEAKAAALAEEALRLAKHASTLSQAADVMEDAVNRSPRLREQHLQRLLLWRRGVMM